MTNEEKESRLMTKDSNDPITILTAALVLLPENPQGKELFAAVKLERAISYLTGDEDRHPHLCVQCGKTEGQHGADMGCSGFMWRPKFVLADKIDVLACPACSSLQAHQEILAPVLEVELQQPFQCQTCGGVNYFDFTDK